MAEHKAAKWGVWGSLGSLLYLGIKLLKIAKLAKIATSGGSMLLSVAAYSLVYGWIYAAGFVALLFCHELGHYVAARNRGLAVSLPTFIPFVGAWIELKHELPDARTEAIVGVAGPLLGTSAAVAVYLAALLSGSEMLLALAYAGFFLNLFNLIPVTPLDGGRVTAIVSPRIWLLGAPMLVAWYFYSFNPLLIILAVMAVPQIIAAFKKQDAAARAYYDTPLADRLGFGLLYLLLVAFLAFACHELHAILEASNCARASAGCFR
jgi:Zn-dependent protease